MESLKHQVVAVLMPLEIKCHTIPHLKALTHSIEHASGQGPCTTSIYQSFYKKIIYFTLYRGK